MIFAYFIHHELPMQMVSFTALLFSAFIISRYLRSAVNFKRILGNISLSRRTIIIAFAGVIIGLVDAIIYRYNAGMTIFPKSLHRFALVAPFIGIMEELVFRGYIQESATKINGLFSIIFSTISHTAYKCCLFLSPYVDIKMDIDFLIIGGLLGSLLFGTLRYYTKSIIPSSLGHGLFDLWVYGEFITAPWWVW